MTQKAWAISVNMGYGHQRTAFPLRFLAPEQKVINANDYEEIPKKDREIWELIRKGYEFVSNFKRVPLIGEFTFFMIDRVQRILEFYPKRDLSRPNNQLLQTYATIKTGWGKDLVEKLGERGDFVSSSPSLRSGAKSEKLKASLPIISTFFTPAFMAEYFNYPGEIFCVVCDADISRTWASFNSKASRIKYFVPNDRVVERLKLYGIKEDNIFLTGYPLPLENIGTENLEILKEDLSSRLLNLDPQKRYFEKYKILIEENLGKLPEKSNHPLTILFSVGGAGVQKEIGIKIVKSLKEKIERGEIKIILSAGIKEKVKEYFKKEIYRLFRGPSSVILRNNVEILYQEKIEDYFREFNQKLRKADILWTKPSELSFYSALGIPIIIAPPIGSQEDFNMRWLLKSGFGLLQENPNYTKEWLFDWLKHGYLAEAAMQGFVEGEKLGTYNISRIISEFSRE